MYADGFLVLLPTIYDAFGMSPLSAGLFSAIRQAAGGLMTVGGGFVVDMFSGKRGLLLAGSLLLMGFGYLLIAAAPNYPVLLITVALAAAAGSFWHPVGLGILSTSFPQRRAFMMAIHRSAGNIGETVTPLLVAAALLAITWRQVLLAGFFVILVAAVAIYVALSRLGLPAVATEKRGAGEQMRSIGGLFKDRALPMLLLVSGLRGMADRAFIFFLPLYIAKEVKLADPSATTVDAAGVVAYHLAIMSVMAIIVPPFIALVADRTGRKPVMVATLIVSSIFMALLWWVGELGWQFTALLAVFGAFRFAVTNLTQAASLDLAEGKRLEGSMIGLLWGNNATWGAISPVLLGGLIAAFATTENEFQMVFSYGLVLTIAATIAGFFMVNTGQAGRDIPKKLR
jgi:MFS transporter, FSR family, fosmidomycin resistance protein